MITRNEIKIPFDIIGRDRALSFLREHCFFQNYPSRKISSVYFDTPDLKFHRLGEDGIVPRDKVRLRWYGLGKFNINSTTLEIKRTLPTMREKYSCNFADLVSKNFHSIDCLSTYKNHIVAKTLRPFVCVTYNRLYYMDANNSRATIDSNIQYHKCTMTPDNFLQTTQVNIEELSVLELKDARFNKAVKKALQSKLIWQRFSKYSRGIESLSSLV